MSGNTLTQCFFSVISHYCRCFWTAHHRVPLDFLSGVMMSADLPGCLIVYEWWKSYAAHWWRSKKGQALFIFLPASLSTSSQEAWKALTKTRGARWDIWEWCLVSRQPYVEKVMLQFKRLIAGCSSFQQIHLHAKLAVHTNIQCSGQTRIFKKVALLIISI